MRLALVTLAITSVLAGTTTSTQAQDLAAAHSWQQRFERAQQLLPEHQPQLVS